MACHAKFYRTGWCCSFYSTDTFGADLLALREKCVEVWDHVFKFTKQHSNAGP